ncbi:unnamed protein product [Brachionus calyciflorus]|uniref:Uncharacterized protein n=1 Tax=Brachionus calyciflorus TaxID=104777 RepID=A0A813XYY8_9BILA|nr:unnamed protein product [Brachionus calyciflorus]
MRFLNLLGLFLTILCSLLEIETSRIHLGKVTEAIAKNTDKPFVSSYDRSSKSIQRFKKQPKRNHYRETEPVGNYYESTNLALKNNKVVNNNNPKLGSNKVANVTPQVTARNRLNKVANVTPQVTARNRLNKVANVTPQVTARNRLNTNKKNNPIKQAENKQANRSNSNPKGKLGFKPVAQA